MNVGLNTFQNSESDYSSGTSDSDPDSPPSPAERDNSYTSDSEPSSSSTSSSGSCKVRNQMIEKQGATSCLIVCLKRAKRHNNLNVYNFQSTDCASSHPKSKNTYVNPESSTPDNRTAIQGIYGETNIITESGDEDVLRPITSKRKHPLIEEISVSQSTSKERNYTDTSNHKKSKHQES